MLKTTKEDTGMHVLLLVSNMTLVQEMIVVILRKK